MTGTGATAPNTSNCSRSGAKAKGSCQSLHVVTACRTTWMPFYWWLFFKKMLPAKPSQLKILDVDKSCLRSADSSTSAFSQPTVTGSLAINDGQWYMMAVLLILKQHGLTASADVHLLTSDIFTLLRHNNMVPHSNDWCSKMQGIFGPPCKSW